MSDAIIYNSILSRLEAEVATQLAATGLEASDIVTLTAANPANWPTAIPKIDDTGLSSNCPDGTSGVFCVWDPQYNRCQSTCTWTVPAGVTKAGFQLWGGGGGSSSGCCCGGHPGGSTGEFVSVVMDVTPGDSYVLCNECNFCCLGYRGGIQQTGAKSYITGPGITTLCAEGGCGTLCSWSCSIVNGSKRGYTSTGSLYDYSQGYWKDNPSTTRFFNPGWTGAGGACFCNSGYDYCYSNSCASCGEIPIIISHCTQSPTVIAASKNPLCGWIPRRWNAMQFDTDHYGYVVYAPTVCFGNSGATTQKHPGSDCCTTFTSGTCCGSQCSTATQGGIGGPFGCMPGHGAVFSHAMGGNNSICGDTGRGAAIRVTYC